MNAAQRLLDDPRLATLFAALSNTGAETRVVGGAVRDALLGLPPHEIDLATTALPDAVLAAARDAGLKGVPTGIEHGTVTIVVAGTPFEVTTLREDVETDGRFAKVRFGGDFEQDAKRRDFTINALSLSSDGEIHDYTDGLADIEARRIRFIGDAATRIREDYLRILRFFRFNASHGEGPFDREGLHELIVARENLSRLSRERIRAELMKLLLARRAPEVLRAMSHAGVIEVILGIGYPLRLQRLAEREAALGKPADAVLRLEAFSVLTIEDAERLRERLRLSNDEFSAACGGGANARALAWTRCSAASVAFARDAVPVRRARRGRRAGACARGKRRGGGQSGLAGGRALSGRDANARLPHQGRGSHRARRRAGQAIRRRA